MTHFNSRNIRFIEIFAFILVLAMGLFVRLEDINDWKKYSGAFFFQGEPLLTNYDGYFYLDLARDIVEGTYEPVDMERDPPHGVPRRYPPPLISSIAAFIKNNTPYSLNWIGAILPAVLGVLIAVPVYFMGRFYGGPVAGIVASAVALLSPYYLTRSSLGWFDTDFLNVTFTVFAAYFSLRFATEKSIKRYCYLFAWVVNYLLFLLWWDSTPEVVTAISLLPLLVAVIFFYRPTRKEAIIFSLLMIISGSFLLFYKGLDYPFVFFKKIYGMFQYISVKKNVGVFPSIGATISEQNIIGFDEILSKTAGSKIIFFLSILGLALLIKNRARESAFLVVPVLLAFFSVFFAARFLIFFAPVIAIGLGYFLHFIWHLKVRSPVFMIVSLLLFLYSGFILLSEAMLFTPWPPQPINVIASMNTLGKNTPKDAIIWAWWDHGYAINYWARRGTIGDGTIHGEERSVYNAIPLATSDLRFASNFMRFYVTRGIHGIHLLYKAVDNDIPRAFMFMKSILSAGPEKGRSIIEKEGMKPFEKLESTEAWLRFFYPENSRPVYLLLNTHLTNTSYGWYPMGTWDPGEKIGIIPTYATFYNISFEDKFIKGDNGLEVDLESGILRSGEKSIQLDSLFIYEKDGLSSSKDFKDGQGDQQKVSFEVYMPKKLGSLFNEEMRHSLFNRLFLRHETPPPNLLVPLIQKSPFYQVWEVRGDRLK